MISIKAKNLLSILSQEYKLAKYNHPVASWKDIIHHNLEDVVLDIYKALGGISTPPSNTPLTYDLEFENFVVQLDEEISFNRYRSITLQSALYENIISFPVEKYRSYCRTFERECLKSASHGNLWTNPIAEKYFGKPEEHGELFRQGSPAWKLKAFDDFIIDVGACIFPIKVIRISIWDNLLINNKMYRINDMLLSSRPDLKAALFKNIDRRIQLYLTEK